MGAVGGENFGAINDEVVSILHRGSLEFGHGRTGPRLTHAQGQQALTCDQVGEEALL
ncbi:hypothetical protein D3C76_1157000 [compost metagenome]